MVKIALIIVLVIFVATFCALNRQPIFLQYFFGWKTIFFPFFLLILASLMAGVIVGFLVGWRERWKLRAEARSLAKQFRDLQEEIEALTPTGEGPASLPKTPEVSRPPLS